MVDKEQITPDIEEVRRALTSAELVRRPDGGWTLIIEVGGTLTIDEYRKVGFYGEARLRGAQSGRRPTLPRETNKKGKFVKKSRKGGKN
jgi:hypothetical protein